LLTFHEQDTDPAARLDADLARLRFGYNKAFGEEKKARYKAALQRFVDLLNACFADHPSPLSWTVGEVEYAQSRPGFDPSTILVVSPVDRADDPVAFVRTVLGPPEDGGGAPVGGIRLVGVLPPWRGRGLGRELLRWGVARLRSGGAGRVQLSVEAENELALGLYRRTGFEPVVEWPHWTRPVSARSPSPEDR